MKKVSIVIIALAFLTSINLNAQIRGNGEVTKQTRSVHSFNGIKIDGATTVLLTQGDNYSVIVETDSNIQEYVILEVKNDILDFKFSTKKIKKYKILKFYVTAPNIKTIKVMVCYKFISSIKSSKNRYNSLKSCFLMFFNVL